MFYIAHWFIFENASLWGKGAGQFSECGKRALISRMRSILYCFTESKVVTNLQTHIADRKKVKIVSDIIYRFLFYTISDIFYKIKLLMTKKRTISILFVLFKYTAYPQQFTLSWALNVTYWWIKVTEHLVNICRTNLYIRPIYKFISNRVVRPKFGHPFRSSKNWIKS